jgi:hypothetical protein
MAVDCQPDLYALSASGMYLPGSSTWYSSVTESAGARNCAAIVTAWPERGSWGECETSAASGSSGAVAARHDTVEKRQSESKSRRQIE